MTTVLLRTSLLRAIAAVIGLYSSHTSEASCLSLKHCCSKSNNFRPTQRIQNRYSECIIFCMRSVGPKLLCNLYYRLHIFSQFKQKSMRATIFKNTIFATHNLVVIKNSTMVRQILLGKFSTHQINLGLQPSDKKNFNAMFNQSCCSSVNNCCFDSHR